MVKFLESMESFEALDQFSREVFFLPLKNVEDFPGSLNLPSPYFVCLLVCNATEYEDRQISEMADWFLNEGLVFLCTWGPECGRVHDLFDINIQECEMRENIDYPVMTTWHDEDQLEDALWFLLAQAEPDEAYRKQCKAALVISIGNEEWEKKIREKLTRLKSFSEEKLHLNAT